MNNIEILEEFIEQYNASYPEEKECVAIYPEQIEALENLIYENKELKEHCKELIKEKQELTTIIEDDCIPKSKIRELLEHYKNTGYDELEEVLEELLIEGE